MNFVNVYHPVKVLRDYISNIYFFKKNIKIFRNLKLSKENYKKSKCLFSRLMKYMIITIISWFFIDQ